MEDLFGGCYFGKKVFLTGHTGFKGSWAALWLTKLGAEVTGFALEAPTNPNHLDLLNLDIKSIIGDIRDAKALSEAMIDARPDVVIHMAAQPLVRYSYDEPVETFETNVMGTVNLLEACRKVPSIRAIINITTDKCYENKEWLWGYRENDPMGGYDPYSASKGCAELVASSYRNSFFNNDDYGKKHNTLLASVRAGNVIGGGDWALDRLIPDIIRATVNKEKVEIRSPRATRPWQHVLEPISGYLALGQKLIEGEISFAEAWNFGPEDSSVVDVENVVKSVKKHWDTFEYIINEQAANLHEAKLLKLDSSKAAFKLGWKSSWSYEQAFERTILWYKNYYEQGKICSEEDLELYVAGLR